jgi:hypothetical protein
MVAARRQTGVDAICAFVGGMHLVGPVFEPVILPTVAAVRELAPEFLVPGALHQLSGAGGDGHRTAGCLRGQHCGYHPAFRGPVDVIPWRYLTIID